MSKTKRDLHFPNIGLINPFRYLIEKPSKYNQYVTLGQTIADLGCGPGFFTLSLAKHVGKNGMVYAVDSFDRAIKALKRRAARKGIQNIVAIHASAANMEKIDDETIDFILANGLLCSVAPQNCMDTVKEIKRILKPTGKAYLMASHPPYGYMTEEMWNTILSGFQVEWYKHKNDFISLVSKKIS